jgi:MoaA/NifB/PqqE/SkfB family radical SAM enzyme
MSDLSLKHFDFSKKFLLHPEQISRYIKGERPFPINIEVDLTEMCNHGCSFCYSAWYREFDRSSLDTEVLKKRLEEARDMGTKSISFTGGGEPMLHRDFMEILQYSSDLGLENGLMTNGSAITDKNIDGLKRNLRWVRVSMAGGNREAYRLVQGKDHFDRVLGNVKTLSDKTKPEVVKVGVRMLVLEENLASVEDFAKQLKETGLDYFQVAPDEFTTDSGVFWKSDKTREIFDRARRILDPIKLLGPGYTIDQQRLIDHPQACYAHFFQAAISGNGDFMFCKNSRGKPEYVLGNINTQTLAEIWDSEKVKGLEGFIRPNNCGLFCKNLYLNNGMEDVVHPDSDLDVNFVN